MLTPWPFQQVAIDKNLEYVNSYKGKRLAGITVAPTGTGKSLIIAYIVQKLGRPVIVLQPSKELLEQNYKKYADYGGMATIYSASAGSKMSSSCVFATPGSVVKYGSLFKEVYGTDILMIDECHHKFKTSTKDGVGQIRQFINDMQPKVILGFTATPFRLITDGMGPRLNLLTRTDEKIFEDFVDVVQIPDIKDEYWKKVEYLQYDFDEGKLIKNSSGTEFTEESIKASVLANKVNNNILLEVRRQIKENGKKAVLVFCDTVANGKIMSDWLNEKADIRSEFVHGGTNKTDREKSVLNFTSGQSKVMINQGVFTTGFDYQALDCVMLGRPTNSLSLMYQKIGRLVRRHSVVKTGLCIDFCGNIKRLGYIEKLTFENVPGYGWGMFNEDRLMSNIPLNFPPKKKKDLLVNAQFDKKSVPYNYVHFGKHYGTHMSDLEDNYLLWVKKNMSNLGNHKMQMFYDRLMEEIKIRNL